MEIEQFIQTMQASIAPCFLISGFGLLLLIMTNRLSRATDRIRLLNTDIKKGSKADAQNFREQISILYKRCRLLQVAIGSITLSIFFVSLNVLFLFANMTYHVNLYPIIQIVFLLSFVCLIYLFLHFSWISVLC